MIKPNQEALNFIKKNDRTRANLIKIIAMEMGWYEFSILMRIKHRKKSKNLELIKL